ncbi:hypothetical protein [Nocardioides limicola]|uniref:hypothetical protein n=1 Tax=Nocardioides limicola TaxID=2803368 RepID=UPI00193BC64E|nr:hypothetical protein [Nocardioides sp. DJM-14]
MNQSAPSDPFWDAVRRRHQDVTLVVLPPTDPAPVPATREPNAGAEDVQAAAERVVAVAESLWQVAVAVDTPPPRTDVVPAGTPGGVVVTWSQQWVGVPDAAPVSAVAGELNQTVVERGPLSSVQGHAGEHQVVALWSQQHATFTLRVTSAAFEVGRRARTEMLRRGAVER